MRHNFVNDIGDYAKYALLRAICASSDTPMRLGVIWYLTDHAESNGDGRKRAHLMHDGWQNLDPELLAAMRRIESTRQGQSELNVTLIESSRILPLGTMYFSEPLPRVVGNAQQRVAERAAWFSRARNAVEGTDLVFLDPDNGLQVRSAPLSVPLSCKYATVAEISALLDDSTGVILYQHGSRAAWPLQRADVCAQIASGTSRPLTIRSLRFGAFGVRAFFCIAASRPTANAIDHGLRLLQQRVAGWDRSRYLLIE
ncbi:MAG TPA: hypothetical protein VH637_09720 [Streptosporangiaceae bacterium]